MSRALVLLAALASTAAGAATFTVTLTNTSTNTAYGWSTGLLTLQPLIAIGPSPQPGTNPYFTYSFANSNCTVTDAFCTGACNDNGNAVVLAQRWGLTLGTNAWLVPAIPANNGTQTITFDAPVGSRLSYIAWVNNTSVFDDFVAIHPAGNLTTLSVPLFNGTVPVENVDFVIHGYDTNSTSATDGSGATCAPECPTPATGCFVAPGNASAGAGGAFPVPATPNVRSFTATAANGVNRLWWTNIGPHQGVIVARKADAAVTWTPTNGTTYTLNQQVNNQGGNPTIITYVDDGANAANFRYDPGANGTRYHYRIFAHANSKQYSNGQVPTSTGILSVPTARTGTSPWWCYATGGGSLQQPVTTLGTAVYSSSGTGAVTANLTTPANAATDGNERWRPVQLNGATQSRPLLVPTQVGNLLLTGDFSGRVTAIRPETGAVVWTSAVLGVGVPRIQAQPVAQLLAYVGPFGAAGTAFAAANPGRDLIFVGTRNGSTTTNQVLALSSVNGSVVWTYAPGDLDEIRGGMAVDYARNRLYVGSHNGMRVLSTLNGTLVGTIAALNGQQFDYGVNLDFVGGQAVSVYGVSISGTGNAYGVNLATMAVTWTHAVGATSSWIFPTGNGFIASMSAGSIRRYAVAGATVTQRWERTGTGIPTGATLDYANSKIYAGSVDGTLRQIDYNDGGLDRTLVVTNVAPRQVGFPTLDVTVSRLHVGTADGRVCAFPIPLP